MWEGFVFEKMFTVKRGDKALAEYYRLLKAMWEELQVYHPLTTRDSEQTA